MTQKFAVTKESCTHCGLCIQDCPIYALEFDDEQFPQYAPGKAEFCIGCQHCLAICPSGAASFGGKKPEHSHSVSLEHSAGLLQLIQSRRSIRRYKDAPVDSAAVQEIVKMLPFIPTAKNADDLYFSLVATKEKMDAILRVTYQKIAEMENPTGLYLLAKEAFHAGKDLIFRGAPAMVAVATDKETVAEGCETVDSVIALSYFELYAQSLGLGTTWCGYAFMIAQQIPEMYALLEIPENYTLGYTMLFGMPAVKYQRTTQPDMFKVNIL